MVGGDRLPRHIQIVTGGGRHRAGKVSLSGQIEHAPVIFPNALFGQTRGSTQHTVGSVRIERVNIIERVGLVQRFRGPLPAADKLPVVVVADFQQVPRVIGLLVFQKHRVVADGRNRELSGFSIRKCLRHLMACSRVRECRLYPHAVLYAAPFPSMVGVVNRDLHLV